MYSTSITSHGAAGCPLRISAARSLNFIGTTLEFIAAFSQASGSVVLSAGSLTSTGGSGFRPAPRRAPPAFARGPPALGRGPPLRPFTPAMAFAADWPFAVDSICRKKIHAWEGKRFPEANVERLSMPPGADDPTAGAGSCLGHAAAGRTPRTMVNCFG